MKEFSKETIEKIRSGDNGPLGEVYTAHYDHCISYLSKVTNGNKADAEDVYMDAIQVLRDKVLDGPFEHDNLRGFLLLVAKNKWRNKSKREHRSMSLEVEKVEKYLFTKTQNGSNEPSGLSELQERKVDYIIRAKSQLGVACQKLLDMHFNEGYKLKELTDLLGYKSYDSIKTSKYKCIKMLQTKVSQLLDLNKDI